MLRFNSDYTEGAHPNLLNRLVETNFEQTGGYGEDEYCQEAAAMIKKICQNDQLAVHFMVGGTQVNLTVIDSALRSHQGVICANTGHINVHETGSIEACGHKILPIDSTDGKISASQVEAIVQHHLQDGAKEHTVQPKMVYISNPTELGTIYSKAELTDLHNVCHQYGLYLFLDGARLAYGLTAPDNDLDFPSLAQLCDVFYIGGTKVGALFGEAVVIAHPALQEDFRYIMKQKGGMLAKGRLLGIQFSELMRDNLYLQLGQHAVDLALKLKKACQELNIPFLVENNTNQQFIILPDTIIAQLDEKYAYDYQKRIDADHSAIRFCTSWCTKPENVALLIADLRSLMANK